MNESARRLKTADERQADFMAELSALCLKFGGAEMEVMSDGNHPFPHHFIEVFLPTQYDGQGNVTAESGSFRFESCDAHWKPTEEQA